MKLFALLVAPIIAFGQAKPAAPTKAELAPFTGGKAYLYFHKHESSWTIGNAAVERRLRFDRETGALTTVGVTQKKAGARNAQVAGIEGEFTVRKADGTERKIRLDRDWVFMWQSAATPGDGGRILTIHLQGRGTNDGLEVEAMYQVHPGSRPYMAKWLTLINRSDVPITLEKAVYDRWTLASSPRKAGADHQPERVEFSSNGDGAAALIDHTADTGMLAWVLEPGGDLRYEGAAITIGWMGRLALPAAGSRASTPKAVVAGFAGGIDTAATLQQRYALEARLALLPKEAK